MEMSLRIIGLMVCCLFSVSLSLEEEGSGSGDIDFLMPLPTTVVIDDATATRSLGHPTPTMSGDNNTMFDLLTTPLPTASAIASGNVVYTSTMEEEFLMTSFFMFPIEPTASEVAMVTTTAPPLTIQSTVQVTRSTSVLSPSLVAMETITLQSTSSKVSISSNVVDNSPMVTPLPTLTPALQLQSSQLDIPSSTMDIFIMPTSTELVFDSLPTSSLEVADVTLIPSQSLPQTSSIFPSNFLRPFESTEIPLPLTTIVMTTRQQVSSMAPLLTTVTPTVGLIVSSPVSIDLSTSMEFVSPSSTVFMDDPQLILTTSLPVSAVDSVQPFLSSIVTPFVITPTESTVRVSSSLFEFLSPSSTVFMDDPQLTTFQSTVQPSSESVKVPSPFSTTVLLQPQPSSTQLPFEPSSTQLPFQPSSTQLPFQPSSTQLPFEPSSTQLPFEPSSTQLPFEPSSTQLPFQPSSTQLPFQPSSTQLLFEPSSTQLPFEPSSTQLPFEPSSTQLPFEPSSTQLPFQPSSTQLPFEPSSTQLPFEPSSTQLPFQPSSTQLPFEPSSTQLPFEPSSTQLPFQPFSTQLPFEPSSTQLPFEPSSTQLPSQPSSTQLLFQPSLTQLPFQPSSTQLPSQPSSTQLPFQPSSTQLSFEPSSTQLPFEPSSTQLPFEPSSTQLPFQPSSTQLPFEPSSTQLPFEPSSTQLPFEPSTTQLPFEPSSTQLLVQPSSTQILSTFTQDILPSSTRQVQLSSMADSQLFPSFTEMLLSPTSTMILQPQLSSSTVPSSSTRSVEVQSSSQNPLSSVVLSTAISFSPSEQQTLTASTALVTPTPSIAIMTSSSEVVSLTSRSTASIRFSNVVNTMATELVSTTMPMPTTTTVLESSQITVTIETTSVSLPTTQQSISTSSILLPQMSVTMETTSVGVPTTSLAPTIAVTMETTSVGVPTTISVSPIVLVPSQSSTASLLISSPPMAASSSSAGSISLTPSSLSVTISSTVPLVASSSTVPLVASSSTVPLVASSSTVPLVASSSTVRSMSIASSVISTSQQIQPSSTVPLGNSLVTTVSSFTTGLTSSVPLSQIETTPTTPPTTTPSLTPLTCPSLLSPDISLESSMLVIKLALTQQEHDDLSQVSSDKRCGLELALGELFANGFKGQTVKRQTGTESYDADISSVGSLSQGSSDVMFFILNGSDPAGVQAVPATTVEEIFMIVNPAQVDSYPILSQPVPVVVTMATPPPDSTSSIIPLAVGLGVAILILLVVSVFLLVCLTVVWNRKKREIVVQSFHQGEPGTFTQTNDFTEYSQTAIARGGVERGREDEERNSVSLAQLANGWTEGGNGTPPVHYKPEPQTEQVPAALFERVAHYDTPPCPQPSPPVRALRMRFRRSVAPSPSTSHKSHSSEDPPRVATPAALRPKPSPPKDEEAKDVAAVKRLSKDAWRLAEQKEEEEMKARRKATLERLLLQSRQRDTDLRSRGGSRRKKKRGTVVPLAVAAGGGVVRPSTHSGAAGGWKKSEPEAEAALGDVETSSPVATPVGDLPAAATPRPPTKRRLLRRKGNKVLPQGPGASTDGYDSTDHYPYGHVPPSRQSRQYRPGRNQRSRPLTHHEMGISGRMSRSIAHDVQRELAWMDTPTGVQLMRIQPILPSQAPVPTYTLPPHPSTHAQLITVQPRPQRVEKLPTLALNSQSYTQRQLETYFKIHQDMEKLQLDHTLQTSIDSTHNPAVHGAPPISIQEEATPTNKDQETPPTPAAGQEVIQTNEPHPLTQEGEPGVTPDAPTPVTLADQHSIQTPPPNLDSSYSSAVNELMQQVFSASAASQQEMQSAGVVMATSTKPDESLDSTQAYVLSRQPMYTSNTPVVAWHSVTGAQAPPTQLYSAPPTHYSTLHPAALHQQLVWAPNPNTLNYMPPQHMLSPAQLSQLRGSGMNYPPPPPPEPVAHGEWVDPFHTPQLPSHSYTRNRTDPFL